MSDVRFCSRCGLRPARFEQRWCVECHAEYMRENRPTHSELTDEQRAKANTRSYSNVLQRRGVLVPEPCRQCGDDPQKHHTDYDDPRTVEWLCRPCHLFEHGVISLSRWIELRFPEFTAEGPIAELLSRLSGVMPEWWDANARGRRSQPRFLLTASGEAQAAKKATP